MYVVQVVQAGSGLRFGPAGRQHHSSNRSVSAEASVGREGLNHGVIHMPPPYEAPQVRWCCQLVRQQTPAGGGSIHGGGGYHSKDVHCWL